MAHDRTRPPPFREKLLAAQGLHFFVQEYGAGEPVLFLAGLGYASWCWRDTMQLLGSRWRTIALDNRGAGRSAKPEGPYSIELMADDAAAVLDALDAPSAHVVGNSMGGYVALTMAVRHPARVRSLLLTNTSRGGSDAVPTPAETLDAWREASSGTPREFAERTMGYSYPPGWPEANRQRFSELLERRLQFPTPPEAWKAQFDACTAYGARGLDVSTIEQEALVVHGTADRVLPYANGVALASALQRGHLRTLEGVGHMPFLERPSEFASLAGEFLSAQQVRHAS